MLKTSEYVSLGRPDKRKVIKEDTVNLLFKARGMSGTKNLNHLYDVINI